MALSNSALRSRIDISRCFLGEPTRYDGGHKHDHVIAEELAPHFQWIPVCPEVECGLGIPRETRKLIGSPATPKLVTFESSTDMTDLMSRFADARIRDLLTTNIHGFILKARSPSCGLDDVPVYQTDHCPKNMGGKYLLRQSPHTVHRFPLRMRRAYSAAI